MTTRHTRRAVLGVGAGAAMYGLAGCLGRTRTANAGSGKLAAQASFFVVGDFTRQVVGDAATANTLVPVGQHGHGWEPGPDVQREVLTADAFVYVMAGFQPWADDIRRSIREDDADVNVVAASRDIELLDGPRDGHEGSEHDEHEGGSETGEHNDTDEHGGSHEKSGGDHAAENASEDESDGEGNVHAAHGEKDPHFWLDPRRAKRAVENVRAGLAAADESNSEAYRKNAAAYAKRIDDLDRAFRSRLRGTPKDVILVAGHNAYQYLSERYGFEIEALTGVSPDDAPTPRDISHAQAVIEEHDVTHVLAPVLESNRAATQLVRETDATGVLPVTALPGAVEAWTRKDWGYIEVMRNVNLPSLATALGADTQENR